MEELVYMLIFFGIFTAFFILLVFFVEKQKKSQDNKDGGQTVVKEIASKENEQKEKKVSAKSKNKQEKTINEHEHHGKEERYQEIVGSLGEVNDEGCSELNGIRLISNDIAYALNDDKNDFDLKKVGRAMIIGEVINDPAYKKY